MLMPLPTTNYEPILEMLRRGCGPAEIIETLGLSITRRQIQRIARKYGMDRPHERGGRLDADSIGNGPMRSILEHCLITIRGLDPCLCSDCGRRSAQKCDIHHTKYEGATIYDLEFICRRCNTSRRNIGLA